MKFRVGYPFFSCLWIRNQAQCSGQSRKQSALKNYEKKASEGSRQNLVVAQGNQRSFTRLALKSTNDTAILGSNLRTAKGMKWKVETVADLLLAGYF